MSASVCGKDVEMMDTDVVVSKEIELINLKEGESEMEITPLPLNNDECVVIGSSMKTGADQIESEENKNLLNVLPSAPSIVTTEKSDAGAETKVNRPSSELMIKYLLETRKQSCEAVETAALDFITELHHPVVSCFREISKSDINIVFNHVRFRSESSEFEQAVTCITFMDYIAATVKNPLYSETFSKSEISIRPCIKKIFLELRRLLRDWAVKDSVTFSSGKKLILKYLRGLTSFFKNIEYDKLYKSAIDHLEKDVARVQRTAKTNSSNHSSSNDRSALVEITSNASKTEDKPEKDNIQNKVAETDNTDDIFDILDEPPSKKKPAPIFVKAKSSNSSRQTTLNWFKPKPASTDSIPSTEKNNSAPPVSVKSISKTEKGIQKSATESVAQKRPADGELVESPHKKLCTMTSNPSESKNINDSQPPLTDPNILPVAQLSNKDLKSGSSKSETPEPELPESEIKPIPEIEIVSEPPKQKVNAFAVLMNRSKELAKEKQLKKHLSSKATLTPIAKAVPTVKAPN